MDNQSEFEHDPATHKTELSSPTSLFEQLALEEPPIDESDTSPSATAPRQAVNPSSDSLGRYLGITILIASFLLTIAAGLIIFSDQGDKNSTSNNDVADTQNIDDDSIPSIDPTTTIVLQNTVFPTLPPANNTGAPIAFLPTAAIDEAAISLLTPIPQATQNSDVVQRPNQPFTERSEGAGGDFVYYTIQNGDTLELIIQRYDLEDFCTIVWSNDARFVSPLRPGNQIVIPPVDGVFAKIRETKTINQLAEETGVSAFEIIDSPFNPTLDGAAPDNLLLEGMQIMVPSGNGGNCNVWSAKPVAAGDSSNGGASVSSIVGFYNLWGCSANITGGGFPVQHPLSGGGQFFQGFSSFHSGVDLSAATGTPVVSAGIGTVIFAGRNNTGYGNVVVIAHGTTFTLYAHLNTYNVSCGQDVSSGQTIGAVGSTGNSSGPHLHFEIRNANFDALDPCYTIAC
jgi:murein DD-endopeptidase MepM/ murein hydrolase activator NlpD